MSTSQFGRASYEIWLTDDYGARIAQLTTFTSLEASRVINGIGFFKMSMPPSFDLDLLAPDRMVQIWRQPAGGMMGLWRVYLIRRWRFATPGSQEIVEFSGPDTNDLLRRRIVAAFTGSAQAAKTGPADDVMKEVVTESLSDAADPTPDAGTRVWANLSVQADLAAGPTITKSFQFHQLLTSSGQGVLDILSRASREAGNEVFFDIVPSVVGSNSISFQFQTFAGQPGQDVSDRVTFDQASGNMRDPEMEEDHLEEENYIYSGGQGEKEDRNIQQVYDAARYGVSQWARCEGFADARDQTGDNGAIASGNRRLNEGRPRIRFAAIPMDTRGTRFGIHWDIGYQVGAKYKARQFRCLIRAASISLDEDGNETIQARLYYEAAL